MFDRVGGRDIDRALLGRMNDSLTHRGPDDHGLFTAPGIGLGHRRLSIIDLAGGRQPLFNEDGSVAVVFNGEIYNFPELTRELQALGHRFATHSDTEVIVHGWEEWGAACVERFRGMFAFAVWDAKSGTLFLARDRLGIKPLYYTSLADGTFLFGSELKSLLRHPGLVRQIDPQAVEAYFAYGYVPDPKSIYRDVLKLAPGHVMALRRGAAPPTPKQYWDVRFGAGEARSEGALCEELIERLGEAVRIRMIAEVPLGAFLSGGVDSSAVVAQMAASSDSPVNSCSISFNEAAYDESAYAAAHAARHGANHHVGQVDAGALDLVDRLASLYDEPFADSSAIPTYRVCALARERVTVALSGDGGDEVFGGYIRYRWHHDEERVRRRLPGWVRRGPLASLAAAWPDGRFLPRPLRAKQTLQALSYDSAEAYAHSVYLLDDATRAQLFNPAFKRELQGYRAIEVVRNAMAAADTDDPLARVQYTDFKTYLPGDILTKVDRASMAHALEVRVPILDHKLVEWAALLPPSAKLRGRDGKYIFKKALEPTVSPDILYRRKMGFGVPISEWFRGPLRHAVREAVTGETLADTGIFDMAALGALVDRHQSGAGEHGPALWALWMFASFLRQVHETAPAASAQTGAGMARAGTILGDPR